MSVGTVPTFELPAAYCRKCQELQAAPWPVLVANAACYLSVQDVDDWRDLLPKWWQEVVDITLNRLQRSEAQFLAAIRKVIVVLEEDLSL